MRWLKVVFWRLLEWGLLPDFVVRWRVRRALAAQLASNEACGVEADADRMHKFITDISDMPIAIEQQAANEQHYEVPTAFFQLKLGSRLKYSSCLWPKGVKDIDIAENLMLELYAERAGVQDGMVILDLGSGWGSLGLFLAEKYPSASIVTLSNSKTQQDFIESRAKAKNLANVQAVARDIATYEPTDWAGKFDRIISIEMFEHMKNYELLLRKLSKWLKDDGKLLVHIFAHRKFAYHFDKGWMTRTFFTGGSMPSHDLLLNFQKDLLVERRWMINGKHYSRTLDEWLRRMDINSSEAKSILEAVHGPGKGKKWYSYWRLFYIICSETFGFNDGNEWLVSHYLFSKR